MKRCHVSCFDCCIHYKIETCHTLWTLFQLLTSYEHAKVWGVKNIVFKSWLGGRHLDNSTSRLARVAWMNDFNVWGQISSSYKGAQDEKALLAFFHRWPGETKIESSWCGEDIWRIQWTIYSWWDVKQKAKYSGYLGTQGDPRRPNALSLRHQGHSVRAFHFVFELDRGGGGWDSWVLAKIFGVSG